MRFQTRLCRYSGAAALRPAGIATAAANRLQVVENEAGIAIATIDEIDLDTSNMRKGAIVDDNLEGIVVTHHVVGIELVCKAHTEAHATAPAGSRIDAHTGNVVFNLGHQFRHLALCTLGQGKIAVGQEVGRTH